MTPLIVLSAFEAIATAVWLLPASISIAEWPAAGPVRLALLAPAWQLAALWAVGFVAAMGFLWVRRRNAPPLALLPASLLWLWAVPYLPWLPDRLPLLLVLAGPVRVVIAAAVVAHALWRLSAVRRQVSRLATLNRGAIFAISLVLYLAFGAYSVRTIGFVGDEPHYLIIIESLLRDGDLKIENNHQQRDYRPFFAGQLRPDFLQRGQNGEIYSIHAPGLPVLLAPSYALGGYRGAVAMICLLAALTALAIFDLAAAAAGRGVAVATWAVICLTVPFVPYAWSIFPELPGALIVAWAALWLWQPIERSLPVWVWRGLVLGVLPWLHTKFALFMAVFAAGLGLRLLRRPRTLAAFAAPMAVSGVLWLYSFYVMYGSLSPEAPYGAYTETFILLQNIPHGLLGIFFDQKFGLFFYSPIYLAAAAGVWLMWRTPDTRWPAAVLTCATAAFVGTTARLYMFWGGSSAPARFLVPILPCLAPMIATAFQSLRGPAVRALFGLWAAIGVIVAAIGVAAPGRFVLFSDPHGRARILEMMQAGSPLARSIPTFTDPDWASQIGQLGWWLLAALVGLGAVALVRTRSTSAIAAATAACLGFLVAGAVVAANPEAPVRDDTARRGALALLWQFDGTRFRTLDYATLGRAAPDRLRELSTVVAEAAPAQPGASEYVTVPLRLPAGAYEAVVWFNETRPREGRIVVAASSGIAFGGISGPLENPARVAFELPVAVGRVIVRVGDTPAASAVNRIAIAPVAVVPPPERETQPVRALEAISGYPGAYLAYMDSEAYPEGGVFWSRGTAATTVLVAPNGARRMTLQLSTGPRTASVQIAVAGQPRTLSIAAGDVAEVSFELPAGRRVVPLTVQSTSMFRPAEVDRSSTDMRGLGCQVRVALE